MGTHWEGFYAKKCRFASLMGTRWEGFPSENLAYSHLAVRNSENVAYSEVHICAMRFIPLPRYKAYSEVAIRL